ncbi:hypothetical protein RI129_008621 [Pyrocoelia pectoralis]|uniref:C2 domain-containing protein n=1 Tax=Pyrocoelia pectoralis TaxID=417401 RepID=A0AAN7VFK2_9COLE
MSKEEHFLINVTVIEGRHLQLYSTDSAVYVRVGNKKRCTSICYGTDSPYFNEFIVFEFLDTFENLLDYNITLTVFRPRKKCIPQKTIGYVILDVATVWMQKDHQFYHKWAVIVPPFKEMNSKLCGFLKVDIGVIRRGEKFLIPVIDPRATDDIERNLLQSAGVTADRQKANYIFKIYRGEDLSKGRGLDLKYSRPIEKDPPSTFVEICFAGRKARTSTKRRTTNPIWDVSVVLPEYFPTLCQRIKINIYHNDRCFNTLIASTCIDMRSISSDRECGFLPTFGPSFLHFYTNINKIEVYVGKILMSFSTELPGDVTHVYKDISVSRIPAIQETEMWKKEQLLLCAVIFNCNMIHKRHSAYPISFEMSFGHPQPIPNENEKSSRTIPQAPTTTNKTYWNIEHGSEKPCLYVQSLIPDLRQTLYAQNHFSKILDELKVKQESIVSTQAMKLHNGVPTNLVQDALSFIVKTCKKFANYLQIPRHSFGTDLKTKWDQLCIKEMGECWPNIYITMICGNKKVAFAKFSSNQLIYSKTPEENGKFCGVLQTLLLQPIKRGRNSTVSCTLDVLMWLDLEAGKRERFEQFLSKFELSNVPSDQDFPSYIKPKEIHTFQGRVHIYQGKFFFGADKSGLSDPFVRIIIGNRSVETDVSQAILNPVWDQTLIIPQLLLYGTNEFIKANPPLVIAEIFDKDRCNKTQFLGRCTFYPNIKMADEPYKPPNYPPKLVWRRVLSNYETVGEILATVEALEITSKDIELKPPSQEINRIPIDIKPNLVKYRLEICFWGLRELRKINFVPIYKPKVVLECMYATVQSESSFAVRGCLNFSHSFKTLDVNLPEELYYIPPVCFKVFDCRSFGRFVLVGIQLVDMGQFLMTPLTVSDRDRLISQQNMEIPAPHNKRKSIMSIFLKSKCRRKSPKKSNNPKNTIFKGFLQKCLTKFCFFAKKKKHNRQKRHVNDDEDIEDADWWTKFFTSLEIYGNELEELPQFKGFQDSLQIFKMHRDSLTGDDTVDERSIKGILKASIQIYKHPTDDLKHYVTHTGHPLDKGIFQNFYSNNPIQFLLRVYCIKGLNLKPKDLSGRSDPYIRVVMGNVTINDKANYIPRQLNPVFGRCFELKGTFPQDHLLKIQIWDYDTILADDMIGETKIDIENRYYSKHRAHCGLPSEYNENGYCFWRDYQKPTTILTGICKAYNLPAPDYQEKCVRIGNKQFFSAREDGISSNRETLALSVLRRWEEFPLVGFPLVPEHVETRSLYHNEKPGIEQGKLLMWLDIFPFMDTEYPKAVNITPRKPISYELRVIIWNTEEVILQEDDFFTGEKMSDIFVKGWLTNSMESQCTDVHYKSTTGEGNFNWRFIFRFKYLPTENVMVILKKESLFSSEETEYKIPCHLTLEVWDNDIISSDDFLGNVTLELSKLPRGSKTAKHCTLNCLDPTSPHINLFKRKRTKGWFPFRTGDEEGDHYIIAGKVELEFELLTEEDASKESVGFGRSDPQALPIPTRPETSFLWFTNPFKTLKMIIFKQSKWRLLKCALLIFCVYSIFSTIGSLPQYIVRKILKV